MPTSNNQIFIVTSEFPPEPGGIGNHAINVARHLAQHQFEVTVVADYRLSDTAREDAFDQGMPFRVLRTPKGHLARKYLDKYRAMSAGLRSGSILIASGLPCLLFVALVRVLSFRRTYGIAIAHGTDINPSRWFIRRAVRLAMARYDAIIPVSKFTAGRLSQRVLSRVRVINNGFDAGRLQNGFETPTTRQLPGSPALITVGSVTERKGQINVIRALPALCTVDPGIHYHIVGLPVEKDKLQALAEDLGVAGNITFHGAVSDTVLPQLLQGADIFIMLSKQTANGSFEGFGIAIIEANAMGVPAIGAKNCGIEDAILPGYSGFLVDPFDPVDIRKAVGLILEKPETFGKQAQEHARGFTWDEKIKEYITVIHSIQNGKADLPLTQ